MLALWIIGWGISIGCLKEEKKSFLSEFLYDLFMLFAWPFFLGVFIKAAIQKKEDIFPF